MNPIMLYKPNSLNKTTITLLLILMFPHSLQKSLISLITTQLITKVAPTYLAFATQSSEELIRLELGLLVRDYAGHLEDEARLGLFVQADRVEREHTRQTGMIVHRQHAESN